ncbi:hypothetical protein WME91_33825 [Sorangium sp. So ce269]
MSDAAVSALADPLVDVPTAPEATLVDLVLGIPARPRACWACTTC